MTEFICKSEKDVKKYVKRILDKHHWFWWMPPGSAFGSNNVDFNAVRGGVFMVVETKFGGNKATPLQLGFLTSVQSESSFAFLVDEHRLEWFEAWNDAFSRAIETVRANGKESPEDSVCMINAIREMTREII